MVTQRLAVLLSAGVSPLSAWGYLLPQPASTPGYSSDGSSREASPGGHPAPRLTEPVELHRRTSHTRPKRSSSATQGGAEETPAEVVIRAAALAGPRGDSVADAIAQAAGSVGGPGRDAWLGLAAAWGVATAAGAPLAACLRQLASSYRDASQLQRDLQVALAGPAATAKLVMVLPLVGVVFGALLGFDTVSTLFTTTPGLVCLAAGTGLMLAAHRWNARLVRGAEAQDAAPGLNLELTAIAMSGGHSVAGARQLVRSAEDRYGLRTQGSETEIERILELSARAGVPAVELLLSAADEQRRDARGDGQRKAATLAVTLMLPLGVCVLPAFMLVGVAPLLLSVVSSTFGVL